MKTAIVDDHLIMRDVLRASCERVHGHKVVAEADTGLEAVDVINKLRPELVLLDLVLPDIDGFEVLKRIRVRISYRPRVLMLSGYLDPYSVHRITNADVHGFVDKRTSLVQTLCDAIAAVSADHTYFSESFRNMQSKQRRDPNAFDKILTDQELRVLVLIGKLLPDEAIAIKLKISIRTLETHRFAITRKLDLRNRAELILYAQKSGFIQGGCP